MTHAEFLAGAVRWFCGLPPVTPRDRTLRSIRESFAALGCSVPETLTDDELEASVIALQRQMQAAGISVDEAVKAFRALDQPLPFRAQP